LRVPDGRSAANRRVRVGTFCSWGRARAARSCASPRVRVGNAFLNSPRTLGIMQLREARLCLDCEELHTADQCPVCASEAFAFVTRWLPVDERRSRVRRVAPPAKSTTSRLLTGATAGVAALRVARWLLKAMPATAPDPTAPRRDGRNNNERRRTDER